MNQAVKIIQNRVNKLGVAEPEIQRQGPMKISVQLPGIENTDEALGRHRQDGRAGLLRRQGSSALPMPREADALAAAGVDFQQTLFPTAPTIIHWGRRRRQLEPTSGSW